MWCEELTHLKRPWCWERQNAGGEGDNRGPDGWVASSTHWTWVWASSGRGWRTRKPGVLQFMGSQRVGHDWVTELELKLFWLWNIKNLSFIRSWNQFVWVLAGFESHPDWFWVSNLILAGFESQHMSSSPSLWWKVSVSLILLYWLCQSFWLCGSQ